MRILLKIVSVVFTLCIIIACAANQGSFLLINHAKESILSATVVVCGQTIELKGIEPAKVVQGIYKVKYDSYYDIVVKFQSGKKLEKKLGYVTNGLDFHHEFVVTDSDIEMLETLEKK